MAVREVFLRVSKTLGLFRLARRLTPGGFVGRLIGDGADRAPDGRSPGPGDTTA